jgi:hypothetical protein
MTEKLDLMIHFYSGSTFSNYSLRSDVLLSSPPRVTGTGPHISLRCSVSKEQARKTGRED